MSNINLICAADLHLGRNVGPQHRSKRSYVIAAWESLVEACVSTKADALLLAGDLIDQDGLFIEIQGVFRKGIQRLYEQGILVIAIAGNHDAKILDQFNRHMGFSGLYLLGRDGTWERKSFRIRERTLHVDGISFTEPSMKDNPLLNQKWASVSEKDALIGLLHCDVDVPGSHYAPVKSTDFYGLPHHAWMLGHIHIPQKIQGERPLVRYCGSLQGLDIGEWGGRGAWKLTIDPYGTVTEEFLPLAPFRWEIINLDFSEIDSSNWESQILQKIEEALILQIENPGSLEMVGIRLKLEGRTEIYRNLCRNLLRIQQQESAGFTLQGGWIPYWVESIKNNTKPKLDLNALALGRTFVAALAKKLIQIQENPELTVYGHLQEAFQKDPYLKRCPSIWPEELECRELYISQGYQLLDELLSQKERDL